MTASIHGKHIIKSGDVVGIPAETLFNEDADYWNSLLRHFQLIDSENHYCFAQFITVGKCTVFPDFFSMLNNLDNLHDAYPITWGIVSIPLHVNLDYLYESRRSVIFEKLVATVKFKKYEPNLPYWTNFIEMKNIINRNSSENAYLVIGDMPLTFDSPVFESRNLVTCPIVTAKEFSGAWSFTHMLELYEVLSDKSIIGIIASYATKKRFLHTKMKSMAERYGLSFDVLDQFDI